MLRELPGSSEWPLASPRLRLGSAWGWSAALSLAAVGGAVAFATNHPVEHGLNVFGMAMGIASAVAAGVCVATGARARGADRAWRLLMAVVFTIVTADSFLLAAAPPLGLVASHTITATDVIRLVGLAFAIPALIIFPTRRTRGEGAAGVAERGTSRNGYLTVMLDVLVIVACSLVLAWTWFLRPVTASSLSGGRLVVNFIVLFGEVLLFMLLVVVGTFREPHNRLSWLLLCIGFAATITAKGASIYTTVDVGAATQPLQFSGSLLTPVAVAFAAAAPVTSPPRRARSARTLRTTAWGHSLLPYAFLAATGASILIQVASGHRFDGVEIAVGLLLVAFVLARQLVIVTENTRLVFRVQDRERELRQAALHDTLTGLANRMLLQERFEQLLASTDPSPRDISLLFIDLDDFKIVNDSLGHEAGDALLQAAATRLLHCTREQDTVARLGGDEFAVLLAPGADPAAARERVVAVMRAPFRIAGHSCVVGASAGLVCEPVDNTPTLEAMLRTADEAMYVEKAHRKRARSDYRPERATGEDLDLTTGLSLALAGDPEGGHLEVHYQPIVNLTNGDIEAVEALARWTSPAFGSISPEVFVPAAERAGLIGVLDNFVLDRACHDLAALRTRRLAAPTVHVNVSATRASGGALANAVETSLARYDLPPGALVVEITETAQIPDLTAAATVLTRIARLGVRIALDDVGAGHSALCAMRLLPIDIIKMDRSLVVGTDRRTEVIRRGLLAAARELELDLVAEGIETRAQLDVMRAAGCEHGQGFWLGRPGPLGRDGIARPSGAERSTGIAIPAPAPA